VTDAGTIRCSLDPGPAPRAVALFVGFASGRARFLDPKTQTVSERPLYRNLPFTRGVRSVLIQSGDLVGDGSGQPGYRIAVEVSPDDAARLSKPGALVLAPYHAPPGRIDPNPPPPGHVLGSQFAVLLTDMRHLAGQLSVLGRCDDLDLVGRIADQVAAGHAQTLLRVELH
jgi:peptidyl-prolyl cis-trans isomerase A (cyclophilin A)